MVAKAAKRAEPLTEAVAPVKIKVGGYSAEVVEARRRGRVAWEKLKAPLLGRRRAISAEVWVYEFRQVLESSTGKIAYTVPA